MRIRHISSATRKAACTLGLAVLLTSILYAGYCDFRLKDANAVLGNGFVLPSTAFLMWSYRI